MRIISGKFKGLNIQAPSRLPVRPTTDFAKTGLFNILNQRLDYSSARVLDLFAGTGGISFEFISRGASAVLSVDMNFHCIQFIREMGKKLNVSGHVVIKDDVFRFLKQCNSTFDLIFADPPYDLDKAKELPAIVLEKDLLNPGGMFIFEHQAEDDYSHIPEFQEKRKYGNVGFSFFQKEE